MKKIFIFLLVSSFFASCSDTESTNPVGSVEENFTPVLKFDLKGSTYNAASTSNTYGSKLYLLGLDGDGNILIDLDVPVVKDELCENKQFKIENEDGFGNCIVYINNEPWSIENGTISVTKNTNSRVSGTFSGPVFKMDYSQTPPAKLETANLSNGVFTDLKVD